MSDKAKGFLKELGGWILYILIIIGLTYFIITFVGQRTKVDGSSMETTLSDGDNLIVDKISYRFRDPERYDITQEFMDWQVNLMLAYHYRYLEPYVYYPVHDFCMLGKGNVPTFRWHIARKCKS